jgi:hypothetical protein
MVEWLLSNDCLESYQEELLKATATGDFLKMYITLLLSFISYFSFYRGKSSYYGEYPLGFACCTNQWDVVEILLKYGADMDTVSIEENIESWRQKSIETFACGYS